jgi:hypothetical protein
MNVGYSITTMFETHILLTTTYASYHRSVMWTAAGCAVFTILVFVAMAVRHQRRLFGKQQSVLVTEEKKVEVVEKASSGKEEIKVVEKKVTFASAVRHPASIVPSKRRLVSRNSRLHRV